VLVSSWHKQFPLENCCTWTLSAALKNSFDRYFNQGTKSERTEAIKFLVAFASYAFGKDREMWDWQQVRHQAQGLYGSMDESPADFLRFNSPLIEKFSDEVKNYLDENS
jgi:hypothetical protein